MSTPDTENAVRQKPARVLIVDDSFLMRQVIRNIVEQDESFTVAGEAADGAEALEKTAQLAPELVLLDIEMPRMDGLEFLREARLLTTARILIISSVTRPGSPQALEALKLGASDIIPKPSGVLSMDLEERKSREVLDALHGCLRGALSEQEGREGG